MVDPLMVGETRRRVRKKGAIGVGFIFRYSTLDFMSAPGALLNSFCTALGLCHISRPDTEDIPEQKTELNRNKGV